MSAAETNAALQQRMVALCAQENSARITAPARNLDAATKKLEALRGREFRNTETAEVLKPETVEGLLIADAAGLDDVAYDKARANLAKTAGIRVTTLDAERSKLRGKQPGADGAKLQGTEILFQPIEPWPESVDGAVILANVAQRITDYVHMPVGAADAISLWIAAAHAFEVFQHAPRLNVTAATRGCGKTLLLDVIGALAPRAIRTENLTQAVLFRIVAAHKPVLLVDECDRHLKDNQELVGLLNAGFTRGGTALRCEGDQNELRAFSVFSPVALSGIGELTGTLHDRSLVIRLERARAGEIACRYDGRHVKAETELKRKLARWATDNHAALADADPDMPQAFNRVADVWRPLFAVAEVAGGDWPARCTKAFAKLQTPDMDAEPVAVQLLQDMAAVIDSAGVQSLPSAELVERLATMDEKPWPTWNHGRPISPRQVSNLLRGFGIRPKKFRDDEAGLTPGTRGYHRHDFTESLIRYVPSATPPQPSAGAAFSDFLSATPQNHVADRNEPKPNNGAACGAVADKTAGADL